MRKYTAFTKDGIKFSEFDKNVKYKGFKEEQFQKHSNKYVELVGSHISDDKENAVIKVASSNILKTAYGYAVIVDAKHVIFIKEFQVWGTDAYCENYVVNFNKQYFNVKEWGDFSDNFGEYDDLNDSPLGTFDNALKLAKEQEDYYNTVHIDADGYREKIAFDWKW